MHQRVIAIIALIFVASSATAQPAETLPDPGPPPTVEASDIPLPPKVLDSSARTDPTVTITTSDSGQITEEYRQNGTVYMVKVTPKIGVTYYLFDSDGDGSLETRWTEVQGVVEPVYYKLKEWK